MRILHITSAKTWRGGEQQIAYLLEGLKAKGVQNTVFLPKGSVMEGYCLRQGHHHVTYRKWAGVDPLASMRLKRLAENLQADLIHIHDSHGHTYVYHAYRWMGLSVPSVVSRRVVFPIKTVQKYTHPQVQRILCVSRYVQQVVAQQIPGVQDKLATIYSGIDVDRQVEPVQIRKRLSLPQDTAVLCCVAALAPFKGHETLLRAMRHHQSKHEAQDIHLVLVGGDGGLQQQLTQLTQSLGLKDKVSFVGHQDDPWAWLQASDIAAFASEREGLGTSVLDAMVLEVPVVSTAVDGLAESVIDRQTALAVPTKDPAALAAAWQELLSRPQLATTLVQQARQHVEQFGIDHMVAGTYDQYLAIID